MCSTLAPLLAPHVVPCALLVEISEYRTRTKTPSMAGCSPEDRERQGELLFSKNHFSCIAHSNFSSATSYLYIDKFIGLFVGHFIIALLAALKPFRFLFCSSFKVEFVSYYLSFCFSFWLPCNYLIFSICLQNILFHIIKYHVGMTAQSKLKSIWGDLFVCSFSFVLLLNLLWPCSDLTIHMCSILFPEGTWGKINSSED